MNAKNIQDIAIHLVNEQKYIQQAMHDFWSPDFLDDVKLTFGQYRGQWLSQVPSIYQKWIADEVETFLKTHSIHGVSLA